MEYNAVMTWLSMESLTSENSEIQKDGDLDSYKSHWTLDPLLVSHYQMLSFNPMVPGKNMMMMRMVDKQQFLKITMMMMTMLTGTVDKQMSFNIQTTIMMMRIV
jgi:hypothetical protein